MLISQLDTAIVRSIALWSEAGADGAAAATEPPGSPSQTAMTADASSENRRTSRSYFGQRHLEDPVREDIFEVGDHTAPFVVSILGTIQNVRQLTGASSMRRSWAMANTNCALEQRGWRHGQRYASTDLEYNE
jgi:hypothetical protein